MFDLFKKLYYRAEALKGKNLFLVMIVIGTLSIAAGILLGYFINFPLNKNETPTIPTNSVPEQVTEQSYEGRITYISPETYPGEGISYYLADPSGKEIVLLRAPDQRLVIAEGLTVKVFGMLSKTRDGTKQVLVVDRVVIKNASN